MATERGVNQGKTVFVQKQLQEDNTANVASINKAWKAAGNADSISVSLVSKMRRKAGLTGGKGRATGKQAFAGTKGQARVSTEGAAKREGVSAPSNGRGETVAAKAKSTGTGVSDRVVDEVEAGIDDLMFKLKVNGGMPEVEQALREARRMLLRNNGG